MADWLFIKKPVGENIKRSSRTRRSASTSATSCIKETDDARPARRQADQLSETLNQALFASKFIGVANSGRSSSDAVAGGSRSSRWPLRVRGCLEYRFEIGDLLRADESAGGNALEDQLKKVTNPDLAVAVAHRNATSCRYKV